MDLDPESQIRPESTISCPFFCHLQQMDVGVDQYSVRPQVLTMGSFSHSVGDFAFFLGGLPQCPMFMGPFNLQVKTSMNNHFTGDTSHMGQVALGHLERIEVKPPRGR